VRLNGVSTSASFFDVLGVRPVLGRTFTAEENEPGRHRVAVLGYALWVERFGGRSDVLGEVIQLDGEPYEVVGVMPAGFDYPAGREIWLPLEYVPAMRDDQNRAAHFLLAIGRRRPGVSTEEGAADIAAIAGRIEQAFPELKFGFGGTAVSLREEMVGEIETPLMLLLGAVGFVLLIACANVANLLLARAAARTGELAIRTALGAERGRLVRQLLTESLLLGLIGGALGLLLSIWGTAWLVSMQPQGIPRLDEVRMDGVVVAFTVVISLGTGLLFGLVPAYQVTRGNLADAIRDRGRGALTGRGAQRTRGILVVVETSLAVMLLVCAGLLIRSFAELRSIDLGFRREGALLFDLAPPRESYPDEDRIRTFYQALEERLAALPGVVSVGSSSSVPLSGFYAGGPLVVAGRGEPQPGEDNVVQVRAITHGLLQALGVPVLRGRGFQPEDLPGSPRVVLLTEAAAAHFFPDEDPIGKQVARMSPDEPEWMEVVGIVGDVRASEVTLEPEPAIYVSQTQQPQRQMTLVVQTSGDPEAFIPLVRRELQALDPNLPLFNTRTIEDVVDTAVSQPRFYMLLLTLFAGAALALSAVGIFGVMSYVVTQRTREIGIRMALGAAPGRVLNSVVGGAIGLALAGVAIGIAGALFGGRLLSALLYGVRPTDPATLAAVAVLLTGVAALASYFPARRAVQVDPIVALRSDSE